MNLDKLMALHHDVDRFARADRYYSYLAYLVGKLNPLKIVELGTAEGVADLMMLVYMSQNAHIYTCDIKDKWAFSVEHPRIHRFIGDDIDMNTWKGTDLGDADLWLIDSDHSQDHIMEILRIYEPLWKRGTVIVFDDISEYRGAWEHISHPKLDISEVHDGHGFGIVTI